MTTRTQLDRHNRTHGGRDGCARCLLIFSSLDPVQASHARATPSVLGYRQYHLSRQMVLAIGHTNQCLEGRKALDENHAEQHAPHSEVIRYRPVTNGGVSHQASSKSVLQQLPVFSTAVKLFIKRSCVMGYDTISCVQVDYSFLCDFIEWLNFKISFSVTPERPRDGRKLPLDCRAKSP
ncbi:hypothetical protein RRG08_016198 [Elysia crispata]|uniref:Uncharacterized protein n=1 Tax=Elysia crispata TaxID=231223 RepID=A0AAE0ZPB2_9GAST|nr:hypothetical protein RRG08_016198 [Elysia crispata]